MEASSLAEEDSPRTMVAAFGAGGPVLLPWIVAIRKLDGGHCWGGKLKNGSPQIHS